MTIVCFAVYVLSVVSRFAIIFIEIVTVPWVCLQCVIVALPGHTHFLFLLISKLT